MRKKELAILASGRGSNAESLILYSRNSNYDVAIVISNKADAPVLEMAESYGIETAVISKSQLQSTTKILQLLSNREVEWIALAGFLLLVPEYLTAAFPNKILNIHPALLPKFGGKGMYGIKVHEAVVDGKETHTGITIHFVNEEYDEGSILFQKSISIEPNLNPEQVAAKVLKLEHKYFPRTLEKAIAAE